MFRAATYNVLATAYIRPRFYPRCDPAHLQPGWRVPALVRHCAALDADMLALQEVDDETYAALDAGLSRLGYAGDYARKSGGKPDGCATFYRRAMFAPRRIERLDYADGSGHVALLAAFEYAGRPIGLANTHLKWAPRGATHDLDQMRQLIAALAEPARAGVDWIIAGDFNATPESAVLAALTSAGYRASHAGQAAAFTCNPNGAAKTIDFLCHTAALHCSPAPLPPIDDRTPLPSADQPSDHLAVVASFEVVSRSDRRLTRDPLPVVDRPA